MTWYDKILTNNYIEIKPVDWISVKSIIGCDYTAGNGWWYNPIFYIDATDQNQIDEFGTTPIDTFLGIGKTPLK